MVGVELLNQLRAAFSAVLCDGRNRTQGRVDFFRRYSYRGCVGAVVLTHAHRQPPSVPVPYPSGPRQRR